MPCLSIELDDVPIATINCSGMEIVAISIEGALDINPKATVDATGGNFAADGCGYLIWVSEKPLPAGEVLRVTLNELCEKADEGKTIAALFPEAAPCTQTDFTITREMAEEIRARPRLHESFAVQVDTSTGFHAVATSNSERSNFSLKVGWDFTRPNQARVYLHSWGLEDAQARRAGAVHMEAVLSVGDGVSVVLDPE